ncbi:TetR/AcrR family transcriptional regulator [Gordonia alkaliphila]|uniref:TetR/AcrR family transcriptional regulator n=1 Tax=Gordonia alkaliphila TaxID=1053547 RepID=UPI001FF127EE|nr:TetR/AcrR family transcriptional regulator [Gordonia alkaliphila]MCK0438441.1 TetR/AcrR family transcriptional regulator [Gordonia alkaliphila]
MAAARKTRVTTTPEEQEAAILAAAAAEFTAVGLRAANMDQVAKAAGVSRSTLYRRFPSKDNLVIALANATFERGMAELEEAVAGQSPADAVVEAFVTGATLIDTDPLLHRMVIEDEEIRSLTSSITSLFIDMVIERVAGALRTCGATMPDELLRRAVDIHVRLVISYLEVPASDDSLRTPEAVRSFAATFLAPMVY